MIHMDTQTQLRADVIVKVHEGKVSIKNASKLLRKSQRTVERYLQKYRKEGITFVFYTPRALDLGTCSVTNAGHYSPAGNSDRISCNTVTAPDDSTADSASTGLSSVVTGRKVLGPLFLTEAIQSQLLRNDDLGSPSSSSLTLSPSQGVDIHEESIPLKNLIGRSV